MTTLTPLCVALYARVSGGRQAEDGTIASQVDALLQRAAADGCQVAPEWRFLDDGWSGATLLRPALERLRDLAAAGALDRLYVYSTDRLSRNFAHQAVLLEEFRKGGVEVVFLNRAPGRSPEDDLLVQVQGIIAEYERAQIRERCRRGKLFAARAGRISVLGSVPYGYRYIRKRDGGGLARYDIDPEQARVVRQIFAWVVQQRLSLSAVARRLQQQGVPTPSGRSRWHSGTVARILRNPAYKGTAGYGRRRYLPRQPRLRPARGQPEVPRQERSATSQGTEPIFIEVPVLVSVEDFAAAAEQLEDNRRRARARRAGPSYLLAGLVVCQRCGYAFHGIRRRVAAAAEYTYYRCGGRRGGRENGEPPCAMRKVRCAALDEAVWADACVLLRHPEKVEEEYRRRLSGEAEAGRPAEPLARLLERARRALGRLIDAYSEGFLDKGEFEPRVQAARERLRRLEAEARDQAAAEARQAELRLALTCLEDFAAQVQEGLEKADWGTRRQILRALVKRVEIGAEEVRIVYRVAPVPFVEAPTGGVLQHCQAQRNHRLAWYGTMRIGERARCVVADEHLLSAIVAQHFAVLRFLPMAPRFWTF